MLNSKVIRNQVLGRFRRNRPVAVASINRTKRLPIRLLANLFLSTSAKFSSQPVPVTSSQDSRAKPTKAEGEAKKVEVDSNRMSAELQQLADRIRYINPLMAEILDDSARLVSDTPWLF